MLFLLLSLAAAGMYTKDRYFLVPAPNWVVTKVPLRFWTNGTVIGTLEKKQLFLMIFNQFLTWMVSERLPDCNDYKLNNKLVTWLCRNKTGCHCHGATVFSACRAACRAASRAASRAACRAASRAPCRAASRAASRAPCRAPCRAASRAPCRAASRAPCRAACCTCFVIIALLSNTTHSFSFILCSKCLVMLLPSFPCILSAALRLRSGFAPLSAVR